MCFDASQSQFFFWFLFYSLPFFVSRMELDAYATSPAFVLFADARLAAHLARGLLGGEDAAPDASAVAALWRSYAFPPAATTYRRVRWFDGDAARDGVSSTNGGSGVHVADVIRWRASLPSEPSQPEAVASSEGLVPTSSLGRPPPAVGVVPDPPLAVLLDAAARSLAVSHGSATLSSVGIDDAVSVVPMPHASSSDASGGGTSEAGMTAAAAAAVASDPQRRRAIVVDAVCGEAVLRGSSVFAAGIVASTGPYAVGDVVAVVAVVAGTPPLKGSFVDPAAIFRVPSQDASVTPEAETAATGPPPPVFVRVGTGVVTMARTAVVRDAPRGVAIRVTEVPTHQPLEYSALLSSPSAIAAPKAQPTPMGGKKGGKQKRPNDAAPSDGANPSAGSPVVEASAGSDANDEASAVRFFLQNAPSMVPAAWLGLAPPAAASSPRPLFRVLDCCAAPGGKASHIAAIARRAWGLSSCASGASFELTCAEKSPPRAKALESLLKRHHGAAFCAAHVVVRNMDAVRLLQEAAAGGGGAGLFDRILLDPPCTGLGLRPRLHPHPHTVAEVVASADYQRHLLLLALAAVRVGGRVSYSTCTISIEENEGVVAAALAAAPDAQAAGGAPRWRLMPVASLPKEEASRAARLIASAHRPAAGAPVLPQGALWARFGPQVACSPQLVASSHDAVAAAFDTCGFFVAVFERLL